MTSIRRVGYAGLGAIGAPMARRILDAGFELHVWNRNADKAAPLVAAGALLAGTPAELASRVDVLCICLTDDKACEQVVFGPDGVVAGMRVASSMTDATMAPTSARSTTQATAPSANAGALRAPALTIADHSTIHPLASRKLAARFAEAGGAWVDAPVSGGVAGAMKGTLSVFAGGEADDVDRVRPVIMSFAGKLTHLGPAGSGQTAKACNQMISFGTAAVLAEALNLARHMGLDVQRFPQAIEGGLADSAALRHCAPMMLSGHYTGLTRTAVKDMDIASDLGRETGTPLPMAGLMNSLYRQVLANGHEMGGIAGLMRLYADGPLAALPGPDEPAR